MRADRLPRRDRPAIALRICTGPLERARGLLLEPALPPATALWLAPCRAVHTFGMREPIDVAFVDARGLVLRVVEACPPWRAVHEARAASVLELRAGECGRLGLRAGERLALPRTPTDETTVAASTTSPPAGRLGGLLALLLVLAAFTIVAGCSAAPNRPPAPMCTAQLEELALQAGLEYGSRNWPAAHAAYAELVRAAPASAEYRYRLGVVLLRLGRVDEAAAALEAARALPGAAAGTDRALAVARLVQARDALAAAPEQDAALGEIDRLLPREFARAAGAAP